MKNKKGPAARKREGPPREVETKRFFDSKKKELESQEARLFLKFLEIYPPDGATLAGYEILWAFLRWLRKNSYSIIHGEDVFCVPFSHLARYKNLK